MSDQPVVDPRGPILDGGTGIASGQNPFTPLGQGQEGVVSLPSTPSAAKAPAKPTTSSPNVSSVTSPTDGTVQPGGPLWMRKWQLSIGPASGAAKSAVDLSLLDFEFTIDQHQNIPPWTAKIKIYNLGNDIIGRIAKELTNVRLDAGYQQPSKQYGNLFSGEIGYYKWGRQNATDTFVEITAIQHNGPINAAVVNTWLPVGYQVKDQINALMSAMAPWGVVLGQMPADLDNTKSPRGRVMFGMARDFLRDIERTQGGHFFIDTAGKLHLLKEGEALKLGSETVPVLTPKTGLIDVPTMILGKGVEATCLLNPQIMPGGQVQIEVQSSSSQGATAPTTAQIKEVNAGTLVDTAFQLSQNTITFKGDGKYTVYTVRHQGQNRGNPWYTHIVTEPSIGEVGLKTSA